MAIPKPSKHAERIAAECRGGKRLCCAFTANAKGEVTPEYFLEPGGETVNRKTAESAIRHGLLVASGDGLLTGFSQTWIAADPSLSTHSLPSVECVERERTTVPPTTGE
jgi:hypothetical protein